MMPPRVSKATPEPEHLREDAALCRPKRQPQIFSDRVVRSRMPMLTQSDYPSRTGERFWEPRFTGCRAVRHCCVSGRSDAGG